MDFIIRIAKALGAVHQGDGEFKFTSGQNEKMDVFINLIDVLPDFIPSANWRLRSVSVIPVEILGDI